MARAGRRRGAPARRGVTAPPRVDEGDDGLTDVDLADIADDDRLEGARVTGDATGRTIDGLDLRGAVLAGCRLTAAVLRGLALRDVVLRDCDLSGADITGAVLHRVTVERCRLSGLVASDLVATDVTVADCRAEGAWLRSARLEHCDVVDCELPGSDWYGATVRSSRLLRTRLDESELSTATFADVALHGSSLAGVRGAALRDVVIGSDQVMEVAVALFPTRGIVIDDDPDGSVGV